MKNLFVFDSSVDVCKFDKINLNRGDFFYLFSLTSKSPVNKAVSEKIKNSGCSMDILKTAAIINLSADKLRNRYIKFIADLPGFVRYKGKNLKDFFAIDEYASLWWFSLIAEKNTYKSDVFNRLVQLDSIVGIINEEKIEKVIFWCESDKLEVALSEYLLKNAIRFDVLPISYRHSFKRHILKAQKIFYLKQALFLLYFIVQFFLRIWKIKKNIIGLKRIADITHKKLLLITPYPNIDIPSAKEGVFRNKFYPCLQEALEAEGQRIAWIAIYMGSNSMSFKDSMKYAQRFIKNGYEIFFLEEFSSVRMQLNSLLAMFKNGLRYLKIEKDVCSAHSFGEYNFYSIFKEDWYSSFAGYVGYQGILYYKMFESLLRKVRASKCLYLCEMHAWEKALILARETVGCAMHMYGYQSGTVSRMLLNYFNHPQEIINDKPYSMPRPEKVICDGRLPYNYMRDSGWPEDRVSIVEAIRYKHLNKRMMPKCDRKKNVVLLAFSISPEESSSILNIAYEALKDIKDREIWVKPHPFLNIKKVFELSMIPEEKFPFQIKTGPIENFLSEARIVICGESGVGIEALAFSCEIVIVNTPEWINMSPLKDIKTEMVRIINSQEELRQVVINIFKEEYRPEVRAMSNRSIVDSFFCLNQDSDIPFRFLELLK